MNPGVEPSISGTVIEALGTLFAPGIEAIQVQRDLNIQSIEDVPLGVNRAGYEISYVDLPASVSGFAQVIGERPHIVVNRAKPAMHTNFTIAHELAHHRLHLNLSGGAIPTTQLANGVTEFEANMFATVFVASLTWGKQQEELFAQNPETRSTLTVPALATLVVILVALVIWVSSRLFRRQDSGSMATT